MSFDGFFREDNGRLSLMRLNGFVALVASIGFGVYAISANNVIGERLSQTFLVASFGGKFLQKWGEAKRND